MCEEKGIDVFGELLMMAATEQDPDKRFMKFKEIAPYLYPKKKEIELDYDLDLAEKAQEYASMAKSEQLRLMKEEAAKLEREIYLEEVQPAPSMR